MNSKQQSQQQSPRTLAEINRQIIEIKKKILLSEGQRKAAFEEYETERKQNSDQILKLKKEIKQLTLSVHKNKDISAAHRIQNTHLETIVGPLANKTTEQVIETLDLQIIDKNKQLDLIKYRVKERRNIIAKLAKEYQVLVLQKPKLQLEHKLDNNSKKSSKKNKNKLEKLKKFAEKEIASPYKKKFYVLQNNIHRVEVQWREAEHIRNSYKTIRNTLLKERAAFENALQQLEEKEKTQQKEIQELQRMNAEAAAVRSTARLALDREERIALQTSRIRERQLAEQEALLTGKLQELERLERHIFQSGKSEVRTHNAAVAGNATARSGEDSRPETAEDTEKEEDTPDREKHNEETWIMNTFQKLKEVTSATSTDDVLSKFQAQKETRSRLTYLKDTTEDGKKQLEIKQEAKLNELEKLRYAQEREKEKFGDNIVSLKNQIEEENQIQDKITATSEEQENLLDSICKSLYNIYLALKEIGVKPSKDITPNSQKSKQLITTLREEFENLVKRSETPPIEEKEEEELKEEIKEKVEELSTDDEILPSTYNALLRRTPLPVQGQTMQISAPIPVADDEEEVPSRNFLKRQAQIVVDAKSRRKALRIPMGRK